MKGNFIWLRAVVQVAAALCHSLVQRCKVQRLKPFVCLCVFASSWLTASAQTWIWYPGDYEIWLSNEMQNRRTERGTFYPVFWKVDSHYPLVDFHKDFNLAQPETVTIRAEGRYSVKLDGRAFPGTPAAIEVPAGKHKINIKVFNQATPPTVFVKGTIIVSDSSWRVTFEDKEWIDETGKASDLSATVFKHAGSWNFNDAAATPSAYKLPVAPAAAVSAEKANGTLLVDFGREIFGFVKLHGVKGRGTISLYYGESREEALDTAASETFDRITIDQVKAGDTINPHSKALRYVNIVTDGDVQLDHASLLHEYARLEDKGDFRCNDEAINRIYDVSKYTLHLSTREFFVDGIKRDRWIWSGDAYQSYLMNYYLMNDNETVKRTTYALRGKDPVTGHINTIMDYTFYWFMGVYDYYLYSGDKDFLVQNYGRMKSLMDFVWNRRNKDGLLEGLPGDWIFIDWATGLSKEGEVSFEQLLFARGLETMALCAELAGRREDAMQYKTAAAELKQKLFSIYWSDTAKALVHSRVNGQPTKNVTRYANMFAIFFNYFNEQQKQAVKTSVLLNKNVPEITTPYMRFYELEALCALGEQGYVLKEMKDYWGGMLRLGATSFWEEYDPSKKGAEHYAMYGRKYGKSLCHAWGASPLYLLGKYYLGISPTAPGYTEYEVKPALGGLKWMEGKVPTPAGTIELYCSDKEIKITSPVGTGKLIIASKTKPVCKEGEIVSKGNNVYALTIEKDKKYSIRYQAM
ncbi:alpha-rhamnosidase [Niabella sp. CC-SYL272]|uniref:alpha-L-rhamnosidase-related protein n=1 Tax=Niabella agricola TaxID=2891571 RepID=UPI001F437B0B|nr:alpha-rhamnosidase [Niabella agricola]MCF3111697.1 alpha-rhamnosidase [Niabella agricola]